MRIRARLVMALMAFVGETTAAERTLAPFRALATPIVDMLRPMPYPEIYPPDDDTYHPTAASRTMFLDRVDRDTAQLILDRLGSGPAPMRVVQLRALGAMARVPSESTAFAHRQSRIMANLATLYQDPGQWDACEAWVSAFKTAVQQEDRGAHVNFLGIEGEARVRAAYPGATWDRLVDVKRRYDPTNLFKHPADQPGGAQLAPIDAGSATAGYHGRLMTDVVPSGRASQVAAAVGGQAVGAEASESLGLRLEQYRVELTGYCYRMLGSAFEAEDAVQDTLVRAWRSFERFEGRAAVRSWLYRIATNVCLDMLGSRQRRARPMDLNPARTADAPLGVPLPETAWLEPIPDSQILPSGGDPAELTVQRDTVRLAFVAALQHLPPKQRAVLILREVLQWQASEVAELLDTSVQSVNSALQRARATLASKEVSTGDAPQPMDDAQRELLARYVDAFERYDMDSLTALLQEDATWNMPPYELWLQTHLDIRRWCLGPGIGCRGSRLIPTMANGMPAFGQYKPAADGGLEPWSLQVLELSAGRIAGITFFLDTASLFPLFGLPPRLDP